MADTYYYAQSRKVALTISDNALAVAYKTEVTDKNFTRLIRGDEKLIPFATSGALQRQNVVIYKRPQGARGTMDALITRLQGSDDIAYVVPVYYMGQSPIVILDEFIVDIKSDTPQSVVDTLNETHGVEQVHNFDFAPTMYLMRVRDTAAQSTLDIANLYYESGLFRSSEPSFFKVLGFKMAFTPNDPLYPKQWHLPRVRTPQAWDITGGDPSVIVAVIDDGFDLSHPELSGAGKLVPGLDVDNGDNDPSPDSGDNHGTSVAGVAIATGDNKIGVTGVAPNCRFLPIRLNLGTAQAEAAAFRFAANNGASIINNSWGPTDGAGAVSLPALTRAAIDFAATKGRNGKGCVIFFAAGNGNEHISSPATLDGYASYDRVIAVAAAHNNNARSGYSDFGPEVDICAPSNGGTLGIFTTDRRGEDGYNFTGSGDPVSDLDYTGAFGGTSAASPVASGVAALMLSVNPDLTSKQVQYIMEATAEKIDSKNSDPIGKYQPNGHSQWYGYGRVDALDAVRSSRGSVADGDHIQQMTVKLRRVKGDTFISDVIEPCDARQRPADQPDKRFIRSGYDGYLRAMYARFTKEADVDS